MAGIYRAQVVMTHKSGLPRDQIVNTWHFLTDPDNQEESTKTERMRDLLVDFYTSTPANGSRSVGAYLSSSISRTTQARIKITRRPTSYLVTEDDGKEREIWGSPQADYGFTLPVSAGTDALPAEVAAVLSFHASYGDELEAGAGGTRPRARRRGRVYVGPLALQAVTTDATSGIVRLAMRSDLAAAAGVLLAGSTGATDTVHWATYSPTTHEAHRVTGGFVDNAPDTQRRRGEAASTRTVFGS